MDANDKGKYIFKKKKSMYVLRDKERSVLSSSLKNGK